MHTLAFRFWAEFLWGCEWVSSNVEMVVYGRDPVLFLWVGLPISLCVYRGRRVLEFCGGSMIYTWYYMCLCRGVSMLVVWVWMNVVGFKCECGSIACVREVGWSRPWILCVSMLPAISSAYFSAKPNEQSCPFPEIYT